MVLRSNGWWSLLSVPDQPCYLVLTPLTLSVIVDMQAERRIQMVSKLLCLSLWRLATCFFFLYHFSDFIPGWSKLFSENFENEPPRINS